MKASVLSSFEHSMAAKLLVAIFEITFAIVWTL
jgi:hypothetical protein